MDCGKPATPTAERWWSAARCYARRDTPQLLRGRMERSKFHVKAICFGVGLQVVACFQSCLGRGQARFRHM